MKYDYIVVGSGLYGSIFAHEAKSKGKSVLVVDKRPNIAGNVYTEKQEGINVHMYGAHIFHTNDKRVWNYITQFAEFNRFTNSPVANYKGELYSMPFNMYTFNKMWGVMTPAEAEAKIEEQRAAHFTAEPKNLEEQAINLGVDYDRSVRRLLLGVTLAIAVATAVVGPISFMGLIIANLSRQLLKTYRHTQLIAGSVLFGMVILVAGQLIVEHVYTYSIPISVFITVGGGVYFLYLLLTRRRV